MVCSVLAAQNYDYFFKRAKRVCENSRACAQRACTCKGKAAGVGVLGGREREPGRVGGGGVRGHREGGGRAEDAATGAGRGARGAGWPEVGWGELGESVGPGARRRQEGCGCRKGESRGPGEREEAEAGQRTSREESKCCGGAAPLRRARSAPACPLCRGVPALPRCARSGPGVHAPLRHACSASSCPLLPGGCKNKNGRKTQRRKKREAVLRFSHTVPDGLRVFRYVGLCRVVVESDARLSR